MQSHFSLKILKNRTSRHFVLILYAYIYAVKFPAVNQRVLNTVSNKIKPFVSILFYWKHTVAEASIFNIFHNRELFFW